jgi:hypothetical protein
METIGRCGAHPEVGAVLMCARCGAFACATCSPSPTLLCADCQQRLPTRHVPWHAVPRPPSLLERAATSIPVLYGTFAVLVVGARFAEGRAWLLAIAGISMAVIVLGVARIAMALLRRPGRRRLAEGLRAMREQRNREAAVIFEEAARWGRLDRSGRALALWLFGACAGSLGHTRRALEVLEPLTASSWRHHRALRLLRGPGQIVLAVTRALDGDDAGAARARADYRPTWIHRLTYAPHYGDALLALHRGEQGPHVTEHIERSHRVAARLRDEPLRRATALLDAFHRAQLGQDDASIEAALAPARLSPAEAHEGLARRWPALAAFVAQRLAAPP